MTNATATETGDRTLAKVRALLAQAEHPNTSPAEAEAFTARATALIAKYGIDEALLAAKQEHREHADKREMTFSAPYAYEKAILLHSVATAMGGHLVMTSGKTRGNLFGMPSDLVRIEMLYTSLLLQSAKAVQAAPVPFYDSPAPFKRSFLRGFANTVGMRLRDAEKAAQTEAQTTSGTSVALVLVDRRTEVQAAVQAEHPRTRKMNSSTSGSGGHAGREAGRRANLGGTSVGGSRQHALA